MKVLIFGGAGFIGANIAQKILEEGGEVLISDDLSRTGSRLNLEWLREKGRVRFFQTDIRHYSGVKEIIHLHRDVDIIFHFAAQVAVTLSVDNPRKDFEITISYQVSDVLQFHSKADVGVVFPEPGSPVNHSVTGEVPVAFSRSSSEIALRWAVTK